jgi:hypothetical protein
MMRTFHGVLLAASFAVASVSPSGAQAPIASDRTVTGDVLNFL